MKTQIRKNIQKGAKPTGSTKDRGLSSTDNRQKSVAILKKLTINPSIYRKLIKKKKHGTIHHILSENNSATSPEVASQGSFDELKKELKPHLEVAQDNLLNPKKSAEEKLVSLGKLLLIAIKYKKATDLQEDITQWIKLNYDKEKAAELKSLVDGKLERPEKIAKKKPSIAKSKLSTNYPHRKEAYRQKVGFTPDEKFKLKMGERLYKVREIVHLKDAKIRNLNVPLFPEETTNKSTGKELPSFQRNLRQNKNK
jgi:hypothetical protein